MLLSRDFRKIARENLRGRWFPAIVVGFLGGLLGAVMDVSYSTEIFTQTGSSNVDLVDQLKTAGVYDAVLPVLMGIGITVIINGIAPYRDWRSSDYGVCPVFSECDR